MAQNNANGETDSNVDVAQVDDRSYLVSYARPSGSKCAVVECWRTSRTFRISTVALILILLASISLGVYIALTTCWWFTNCRQLSIMSLNTWGMPYAFGSQYKEARMKAIADEVAKAKYDVIFMQELWMEPDHTTIANALPPGYQITGFRQLSLSDCDGRISPIFCSGLTIITRDMEIVKSEFQSYTYHGDVLKSWVDGEYLARKGVGRLRVNLPLYGPNSPSSSYLPWNLFRTTPSDRNITMDLVTTHTAAEPPLGNNYSNAYYRDKQVDELVHLYLNDTGADLIIFGADINAAPIDKPGEPYYMLKDIMTNCIEEFYYVLAKWLNSAHATYGNSQNTFSNGTDPAIIDYIFYRRRPESDVHVFTSMFQLPFYKFLYSGANDTEAELDLSLSDHEAVTTTIHIWTVQS